MIFMIVFCISLSACDEYDLFGNVEDEYFKNVNMPLVYEIYLDYMEETGETPLTYEEWFAAVHGDEFQKGVIPEIRKNDTTEFWEISYNNGEGWNDLRFKTETEEQKNCNHTFEPWITICEANDYCNGIRYRSCKNCNYKDYQFKVDDDVCVHSELITLEGKPATCASQGLTEGKKCAECGMIIIEQKPIKKLDHVYVTDKGFASTCTTTGLTDGSHCSVCKKILATQQEIPLKAHNYINRVCTDCGDTLPYSMGLEYALNSDGTCCVTGIGKCVDTEVYIPEYFGIYKVTGIGDFAFSNCSHITNIVLPNSITSIGNHALDGCTGLTYNEYDNAYYFGNDSNPYLVLMQAKSQSITSCEINPNTKIIYTNAFNWCDKLTSIVIPDGVTNIGFGAFQVCYNLTSVVIPDSVIIIDQAAFWNCSSITNIVIPANVTSISNEAFNYCDSLESISVDEGNTVYHSAGNCLIETTSKTLIAGCKNSVIPSDGSVTGIGENAFTGCWTLTNIVIPNSVTSIGRYAFSGCSSLTSVKLPDNVTSIGNYAFDDCSSLTSIEFGGTKAQWYAIPKGDLWNSDTGNYTVHCTDGDIVKSNS